MKSPIITLEKPTKLPRPDERFDRGERLIMVDGVRWGRTHVSSHGVHGQRHTFQQQDGGKIIVDPKSKHAREVSVSSKERGRSIFDSSPKPTTEEKVLATVRELVATGKLRDPAIVRAENAESMKLYRAQQEAGKAREEAEFLAKAKEAAGYDAAFPVPSNATALVGRIVAAMRWAQTK